MPMAVEAHGKPWIAVYTVTLDDDNTYYLAVERDADGNAVVPSVTTMIAVPHIPEVAAMMKRARAHNPPR